MTSVSVGNLPGSGVSFRVVSEACALLVALFVLIPAPLRADSIALDFESLTDGEFVTTQFPGLTFSNAIVLTAGVSVNELEFPPQSGNHMISDIDGRLSISFGTLATSFGGFFTYRLPLTLETFDSKSLPRSSFV